MKSAPAPVQSATFETTTVFVPHKPCLGKFQRFRRAFQEIPDANRLHRTDTTHPAARMPLLGNQRAGLRDAHQPGHFVVETTLGAVQIRMGGQDVQIVLQAEGDEASHRFIGTNARQLVKQGRMVANDGVAAPFQSFFNYVLG